MDEYQKEVLQYLKDIRDLLEPIAEGSKRDFLDAKLRALKAAVTAKNSKVLPLLFDQRGLTQTQIAFEANASQPTVSRLIAELKQANLIEEVRVGDKVRYQDKYDLVSLIGEKP